MPSLKSIGAEESNIADLPPRERLHLLRRSKDGSFLSVSDNTMVKEAVFTLNELRRSFWESGRHSENQREGNRKTQTVQDDEEPIVEEEANEVVERRRSSPQKYAKLTAFVHHPGEEKRSSPPHFGDPEEPTIGNVSQIHPTDNSSVSSPMQPVKKIGFVNPKLRAADVPGERNSPLRVPRNRLELDRPRAQSFVQPKKGEGILVDNTTYEPPDSIVLRSPLVAPGEKESQDEMDVHKELDVVGDPTRTTAKKLKRNLEWLHYWGKLDELHGSEKLLLCRIEADSSALERLQKQRDWNRERFQQAAIDVADLRSTMENEREHFNNVLNSGENKLNALRAENERVMAKANEMRRQVTLAENAMYKMRQDTDKYITQLARAKQQLEEYKNKHAYDVAKMTQQLGAKHEADQQKEIRLLYLEDENSRIHDQLKTLIKTVEVLTADNKTLQAKVEAAGGSGSQAVQRKVQHDNTSLQQLTQKSFQKREKELLEQIMNMRKEAEESSFLIGNMKNYIASSFVSYEKSCMTAEDADACTGVVFVMPKQIAELQTSQASSGSKTGKGSKGQAAKKPQKYICSPIAFPTVPEAGENEIPLENNKELESCQYVNIISKYQRLVWEEVKELMETSGESMELMWRQLDQSLGTDSFNNPEGKKETLHLTISNNAAKMNKMLEKIIATHLSAEKGLIQTEKQSLQTQQLKELEQKRVDHKRVEMSEKSKFEFEMRAKKAESDAEKLNTELEGAVVNTRRVSQRVTALETQVSKELNIPLAMHNVDIPAQFLVETGNAQASVLLMEMLEMTERFIAASKHRFEATGQTSSQIEAEQSMKIRELSEKLLAAEVVNKHKEEELLNLAAEKENEAEMLREKISSVEMEAEKKMRQVRFEQEDRVGKTLAGQESLQSELQQAREALREAQEKAAATNDVRQAANDSKKGDNIIRENKKAPSDRDKKKNNDDGKASNVGKATEIRENLSSSSASDITSSSHTPRDIAPGMIALQEAKKLLADKVKNQPTHSSNKTRQKDNHEKVDPLRSTVQKNQPETQEKQGKETDAAMNKICHASSEDGHQQQKVEEEAETEENQQYEAGKKATPRTEEVPGAGSKQPDFVLVDEGPEGEQFIDHVADSDDDEVISLDKFDETVRPSESADVKLPVAKEVVAVRNTEIPHDQPSKTQKATLRAQEKEEPKTSLPQSNPVVDLRNRQADLSLSGKNVDNRNNVSMPQRAVSADPYLRSSGQQKNVSVKIGNRNTGPLPSLQGSGMQSPQFNIGVKGLVRATTTDQDDLMGRPGTAGQKLRPGSPEKQRATSQLLNKAPQYKLAKAESIDDFEGLLLMRSLQSKSPTSQQRLRSPGKSPAMFSNVQLDASLLEGFASSRRQPEYLLKYLQSTGRSQSPMEQFKRMTRATCQGRSQEEQNSASFGLSIGRIPTPDKKAKFRI